MNIDKIDFEQVLFEYVKKFKLFNEYLIDKYHLDDIPYNLSGKKFPKIGTVVINHETVSYRFHGQGCTIIWNNLSIFFNIDASVIHNSILLTPGGWYSYLESYFSNFEEINSKIDLTKVLFDLEKKGALFINVERNKGSFNVNDDWFYAKLIDPIQ